MLTLQKLKEMKPHTIFLKGEIVDSPDGINMENTGRQLRWVAVRGGIHDWAIYCHLAEKDWDFIRTQGNKVSGEENIKRLVSCDEEAFEMYRH